MQGFRELSKDEMQGTHGGSNPLTSLLASIHNLLAGGYLALGLPTSGPLATIHNALAGLYLRLF